METNDMKKNIATGSAIIAGVGTATITANPFLGIIAGFGTHAVMDKMLNESSKFEKVALTSKKTLSNTLVLIINNCKKQIINKLKNQDNTIKAEDCDDLYSITQALWNGSQKDFESILFPKGFNSESKFALLEAKATEYDVYFVKIELTEFIEGFGRGADQGARLSAFRTLAGKKVEISPPLLPTAYENTNVYSC